MKYEIANPWIHITMDETFHMKTLAQFFDAYQQSKKNRYLLLQQNHILLNKKNVTLEVVLHKDDVLSILLFPAINKQIEVDETAIEIAYEDEFLLIVNKPPHLLIHSDGNQEATLSNRVQHYFQQTNQSCPVHPIHRLDKETSGLVIFCKCLFFQPYFDDLLQQKKIHREYVAIVHGHLPLHQIINIEQPIARDRHNAKKQRISSSGKEAYTSVVCEQHIGKNSLVYCTLKTGRTHQIRVHLAYLKHPILADTLYGNSDARMPRLALHAYKISWIHPLTFQHHHLTIELPEDMKKIL